jgi:hypothetical protein
MFSVAMFMAYHDVRTGTEFGTHLAERQLLFEHTPPGLLRLRWMVPLSREHGRMRFDSRH